MMYPAPCPAPVLYGGWIYIMVSSSTPGRFKLGMTDLDPESRRRQLRTADPDLLLVVAYFIPEHRTSLRSVEKLLHERLAAWRVPFAGPGAGLSEFFRGDAHATLPWLEEWMAELTHKQICVGLQTMRRDQICRLLPHEIFSIYRAEELPDIFF